MADRVKLFMDAGSKRVFLKEMKITEEKLKDALFVLADTASKKIEAWAKQNARWTDRTTNARQGLKGEAYWENKEALVVAIMHQVDYGIWLELAMEKRYAILEEPIEQHKDELIKQYRKLVEA